VFDPTVVPATFWRRDDVQLALARREVGRLFQTYLQEMPGCTQTQLALLTEHDRSDISNWVRGVRQGRVSDIEVLTRIADGLQMPDEARVLLGLAPADTLMATIRDPKPMPMPSPTASAVKSVGGFDFDNADTRPTRLAICGSRGADTDNQVIDAAVRSLARLILTHRFQISHGPVGVGIEVMTYIADHYRPPDFTVAVGLFGRPNVVRDAHYVLVIGGAAGTQDEIDLAVSMGKRIIALPASGGTALRFHRRASRDPRLRAWLSDEEFALLDASANLESLAGEAEGSDRAGEQFVRMVEDLTTDDPGGSSA